MATESDKIVVHPGDIIQDSGGYLYLVSETHGWGVGAVQRWVDGGTEQETYHRLKPGQFVVIGPAHILPKEIAERRNEARRHEAEVQKDAEQ